jgi:hypothetical protein
LIEGYPLLNTLDDAKFVLLFFILFGIIGFIGVNRKTILVITPKHFQVTQKMLGISYSKVQFPHKEVLVGVIDESADSDGFSSGSLYISHNSYTFYCCSGLNDDERKQLLRQIKGLLK